jgi:ribulose-phosphate 3-epimerase
MVTDPALYVRPFAEAGANHLTFHIEAVPQPARLVSEIRDQGMTAGIALNPPTPVERILAVAELFDLLLVMSVNPGFSGQAFIPEVLHKVRALRDRIRPTQRIEIDGGVNERTADACRKAGCDVLVAASAIFGSDDYAGTIAALRGGAVSRARTRRKKPGEPADRRATRSKARAADARGKKVRRAR